MADRLPPIVLLHGWGGSFAATFARTGWVEALSDAGREVVGIDLPGHGGGGPIDPEAYSDLAGLVDAQLPDGPLDLVGFSLGAKISLAVAARKLGRFRRIVVGGVGNNLFAPEPAAEILATALDGGGDRVPRGIASLVAYVAASGNDPRAMAAVLRRPANPVLALRDLARVEEVLLVKGSIDKIAHPDNRLRAALGSPAYLALAGVDHFALPSTAEFRRAAIAHLAAPVAA